MKRFLILLFMLFCGVAFAATETINWYMDGNTYATTTCQTGGDIILPTTPYKYGYTFQGWVAYIPIEYIESTGAQWINADILQKNTLTSIKQYIGFGYSQLPNRRELSGFDASKDNYFGATPSGSNVVFDIQPSPKGTYPIQANTKYDLYMEQTNAQTIFKVFLNNNLVDSLLANNYNGFNSSSLYIFRTSSNYTPLSNARIYYYRVYFDDTLVRDFIPVLYKDGTPCMYDKVTDKCFYNSGTGNFIAGPVITE